MFENVLFEVKSSTAGKLYAQLPHYSIHVELAHWLNRTISYKYEAQTLRNINLLKDTFKHKSGRIKSEK